MGNKSRNPKGKAVGKKWKRGQGRKGLAEGKQLRASGNLPNKASLNAAVGNRLRKTTLAFIGAVTRTARGRKALIDALARQQEAQQAAQVTAEGVTT